MSLLLTLLGWTRLPPWMLELLAVGLVLVAAYSYHAITLHAALKRGVAEQRDRDTREAREYLNEQAARADQAELAYEQSHEELERYRMLHPVFVGELCEPPHRVPAAPAARPGAGHRSPAPTVFQSLPATDHGQLYDRPGLLGALAALADREADVHREFLQRR